MLVKSTYINTFKRYGYIFLLWLALPCFAQRNKVDSLQNKLRENVADTIRLKLLKEITSAYSSVDQPKKFYYANLTKDLAEKVHNESAVADAYLSMGVSYAIRAKLDSALYYFTIAYNRAEKANYAIGMGKSLVNIGYAHDRLDDKREAIKYDMQALDVFIKAGFQKGIDQCNANVGSLYFDLRQYKIAETYFKQCLKSYTKSKDENGMANVLFSIGDCERELGNITAATDYLDKSLALNQKLNNINGIALAKMGLGILHTQIKQYDKALDYLNAALTLVQGVGDKYEEAAIQKCVADVYLATKDYARAEQSAQQELTIGRGMKSKLAVAEALKNLVEVYKSQNNLSKAFNYQSLYILTEDSLLTEKALKDITLAEFSRMRTENASLAKNNEDYAQQISHYSDVIVSTSITLVCVILLSLMLYRRNLEKQASNKLLSEQKEEIALINHELESLNEELSTQIELTHVQNIELERLNGIKNKFFSIISHDLRGPLNNLRSLFTIYREGDIGQEELAMMLARLEETILTTGEFLDNLLEWSKSQLEGIVITPVDFDITVSIIDNIHLFESKINEKQLKVTNLANDAVVIHADQNMIDLVIRNLLSNSVKFCKPGDEITLSAKMDSGRALIAIHDTGPGFSEADKEKLFSLEHIVSTGTQGEKGNHLGLILCRDMVIQNKGNIWLESNTGQGTTFWIELPLSS